VRPDLYVDGAHNPLGGGPCRGAAELRSGYRRLVLVLGILQDKDHDGIIARLAPLADRIVVTRPGMRGPGRGGMTAAVRRVHASVASADTVDAALSRARAEASPDDLIVVTGSLYTVGDAADRAHGPRGARSRSSRDEPENGSWPRIKPDES